MVSKEKLISKIIEEEITDRVEKQLIFKTQLQLNYDYVNIPPRNQILDGLYFALDEKLPENSQSEIEKGVEKMLQSFDNIVEYSFSKLDNKDK